MSAIPVAKLGGIYKRLETDAEYRERLRAAGHPVPEILAVSWLDEHGDRLGMQRRIVESTCD